ncbi:hypothetical protein AB0D97_28145 [Streptomyces roseus]|uniref:hypothetical protein n=1 Tax=Streptomyces roseus TaxID=66430 RepID=UPI0033C089FB
MSNENVITIGIRGHEKAALEAAHGISTLFLSSGPCRLRRTPGEDEVQVLVYPDVSKGPSEGGYLGPRGVGRLCQGDEAGRSSPRTSGDSIIQRTRKESRRLP